MLNGYNSEYRQRLDKFILPKNFRGRNPLTVQIWWLVQSTLFCWSPQICYGWRRWLLRLFGANIGSRVLIRPSVRVTYPWKLSIGDNSWVGDNVTLYSLGEIRIGKNTVVSQLSYICTGSHDYKSKEFRIYSKPVIIEDGVWIASDVFVHPGVTIHCDAVIAARSTLNQDALSGYIYVGNPAKPIKTRF